MNIHRILTLAILLRFVITPSLDAATPTVAGHLRELATTCASPPRFTRAFFQLGRRLERQLQRRSVAPALLDRADGDDATAVLALSAFGHLLPAEYPFRDGIAICSHHLPLAVDHLAQGHVGEARQAYRQWRACTLADFAGKPPAHVATLMRCADCAFRVSR